MQYVCMYISIPTFTFFKIYILFVGFGISYFFTSMTLYGVQYISFGRIMNTVTVNNGISSGALRCNELSSDSLCGAHPLLLDELHLKLFQRLLGVLRASD